jgi:hypothetical protein
MPPRKAKKDQGEGEIEAIKSKGATTKKVTKKPAKKSARRMDESDDESEGFSEDDIDINIDLYSDDSEKSTKSASRKTGRSRKGAAPTRKVRKTNDGGDVKEESKGQSVTTNGRRSGIRNKSKPASLAVK